MTRRMSILLVLMGAALLMGSGLALAAPFVGTPGPDRIEGTDEPDQISGLGDNDILIGKDGDDQIDGGEGNDDIQLFKDVPAEVDPSSSGGNDTILGGDDVDVIQGGLGADNISGGEDSDAISGDQAGDTISGDGGDDLLLGFYGADRLDGGPDDDLIFDGPVGLIVEGAPKNRRYIRLPPDLCNVHQRIFDVPGDCVVLNRFLDDNDQDTLSGGDGDDKLFAYNKPARADIVNCGPGNDTARVDKKDVVAPDCEKVRFSR